MTTLRPRDVSVGALASVRTHGATTISATTLGSPPRGYAVPREDSRRSVLLDGHTLGHVTDYVALHRAELARAGCYLHLTLYSSAAELCVVDVVQDDSRIQPGSLPLRPRHERASAPVAA
jgi:hypothetical protein